MHNFKRVVGSFIIIGVFLLALSFFREVCYAQDIAEKVDTYIEALNNDTFSGSILIAQNGKVLVSKGYGLADYEQKNSNKPNTMYRIGSVTKQFTAAAIMKLQEKGLLNVHDPIKKYIPDYPNGDKITIHHLLTHSSGIPNFTDLPNFIQFKTQAVKPEKTIALFNNLPLEFPPGENFNYSNSGYVLLGYIIEKATGESYETYLKEDFFMPLGMLNTGYDYNAVGIKNHAIGYRLTDSGVEKADFIDMSVPYAAGALYSTVEDLYRWDRALYTEKVLSKQSVKQMFTPFIGSYGYGWFISEAFGHKDISHGGAIDGFVCEISRFIEDDTVIIVLTNNESVNISDISRNLAAIVFGEDYELPKPKVAIEVNPKLYDDYVGTYQIQPGFNLVITKENNMLFAQATGQGRVRLYPESETRFFLKVVNAQVSFVRDENGKVSKLLLFQNGGDYAGEKIE